jgi:dienelactone hydrolase
MRALACLLGLIANLALTSLTVWLTVAREASAHAAVPQAERNTLVETDSQDRLYSTTENRQSHAYSPQTNVAMADAAADKSGGDDTIRTKNAEGNQIPAVDLDPFFEPPPEYRDKFGNYRSLLKFYDGRPVRTKEDWQARREEIKKAWRAALGPWPPLLEHPKLEILDARPLPSYTRNEVRIEIAPGGRTVDCYLLRPKGEGPFPAAIVVFWDSATGIGEGKTQRSDFAKQLTLRGFVTLSIGTPNSVEYYPTKDNPQMQPLMSRCYAAANCHTALANLPYVDGKRIGIVGQSYGGKWAMFASCLYEKFACAVWSDGAIVFDEQKEDADYWDSYYIGYEPGLPLGPRPIPDTPNPSLFLTPTRRSGFGVKPIPGTANPRTGAYKQLFENGHDLHELHALMAPRPFLVSGGEEDGPERWIPLNHTIAVNRLLGFEKRVAMTNREHHSPTPTSKAQIYAFFERFLKTTPSVPRNQ